MNPDLPVNGHKGRYSDAAVRPLRNRNLRLVSSTLDPDELDNLATREGISNKGAGWRTDFGPDRASLNGFLTHRTGLPWDQVYSEVSRAFGKDGRDILEGEVLIHTYFDEEGAIRSRDYLSVDRLVTDVHGGAFYVHPTSRILMWAPAPRRTRKRDAWINALTVDGRAYFIQHGAWFSSPPLTHEEFYEKSREAKCGQAAYLRRGLHLPVLVTAIGDFCCDPDDTRQVSSRTIKRLKLQDLNLRVAA